MEADSAGAAPARTHPARAPAGKERAGHAGKQEPFRDQAGKRLRLRREGPGLGVPEPGLVSGAGSVCAGTGAARGPLPL